MVDKGDRVTPGDTPTQQVGYTADDHKYVVPPVTIMTQCMYCGGNHLNSHCPQGPTIREEPSSSPSADDLPLTGIQEAVDRLNREAESEEFCSECRGHGLHNPECPNVTEQRDFRPQVEGMPQATVESLPEYGEGLLTVAQRHMDAASALVDLASSRLPDKVEDGADVVKVGRYFEGGAYRDTDEGKHDYEGYLSPLVLQAYGEYMTKHRMQSDGNLRDSDNWQHGIPRDQYMKSAFRHFMDWWLEHRGYQSREGMDEALGGLLFNLCGYWHETLKEDRA